MVPIGVELSCSRVEEAEADEVDRLARVGMHHVGLRGGPAPVRRFLPDLIDRVLTGRIEPGQVFDLTLPLEQVADGYRAMDDRRAIKTLLRP